MHPIFPKSRWQHTRCMCACQVASVVSDSLWSYGLEPARLLYQCDSPGKNTGVGCHALVQGILPTQGWNQRLSYLLHWQAGSLPLMPTGKPWIAHNRSAVKSLNRWTDDGCMGEWVKRWSSQEIQARKYERSLRIDMRMNLQSSAVSWKSTSLRLNFVYRGYFALSRLHSLDFRSNCSVWPLTRALTAFPDSGSIRIKATDFSSPRLRLKRTNVTSLSFHLRQTLSGIVIAEQNKRLENNFDGWK